MDNSQNFSYYSGMYSIFSLCCFFKKIINLSEFLIQFGYETFGYIYVYFNVFYSDFYSLHIVFEGREVCNYIYLLYINITKPLYQYFPMWLVIFESCLRNVSGHLGGSIG